MQYVGIYTQGTSENRFAYQNSGLEEWNQPRPLKNWLSKEKNRPHIKLGFFGSGPLRHLFFLAFSAKAGGGSAYILAAMIHCAKAVSYTSHKGSMRAKAVSCESYPANIIQIVSEKIGNRCVPKYRCSLMKQGSDLAPV